MVFVSLQFIDSLSCWILVLLFSVDIIVFALLTVWPMFGYSSFSSKCRQIDDTRSLRQILFHQQHWCYIIYIFKFIQTCVLMLNNYCWNVDSLMACCWLNVMLSNSWTVHMSVSSQCKFVFCVSVLSYSQRVVTQMYQVYLSWFLGFTPVTAFRWLFTSNQIDSMILDFCLF